jgi:hypothetical protein
VHETLPGHEHGTVPRYYVVRCTESLVYKVTFGRPTLQHSLHLAKYTNKCRGYRHYTWSIALREERRLRVLGNRVLRRIFGRKPHNEEFNDLYCSPNIVRVIKSRRVRWAEHLARMGERRGIHWIMVGKPEGKRSLRRPRRRF